MCVCVSAVLYAGPLVINKHTEEEEEEKRAWQGGEPPKRAKLEPQFAVTENWTGQLSAEDTFGFSVGPAYNESDSDSAPEGGVPGGGEEEVVPPAIPPRNASLLSAESRDEIKTTPTQSLRVNIYEDNILEKGADHFLVGGRGGESVPPPLSNQSQEDSLERSVPPPLPPRGIPTSQPLRAKREGTGSCEDSLASANTSETGKQDLGMGNAQDHMRESR